MPINSFTGGKVSIETPEIKNKQQDALNNAIAQGISGSNEQASQRLGALLKSKQMEQQTDLETKGKKDQAANAMKTLMDMTGTKDPQSAMRFMQMHNQEFKLPDVSVNKGFNPLEGTKEAASEGKKLNDAKKAALGKMEDGLGMAQNAEAFLNNPNQYSISELKVLIPMMQGWPARAIGTESKASGFDAGGWNTALKDMQKYADDPKTSPLTQNTLDTFRSNFEVIKGNQAKRYDAANKNFWENTAPSIAPTLSSQGHIDKLRAGSDDMIKSQYGDYHTVPWKHPTAPAVSPITTTQAPPPPVDNRSGVAKFLSGAFGSWGKDAAPTPAAPSTSKMVAPPGIAPQGGVDPIVAAAQAEKARRAALANTQGQ